MRRRIGPAVALAIGAGVALALFLLARALPRKPAPRPLQSPEDQKRAEVVAVALAAIDHPPTVSEVWTDTAPILLGSSAAWCGGFALWVLHRAGLLPGVPWEVGTGFCFRLPLTTAPLPGDVVYFAHLQHHAILVRLDGDAVETVDGNQPGVARRRHARADVAGFYSIAPAILGMVNA